MPQKVTDPRGEPIQAAKLPFKYLCLYPKSHVAPNFSYRSFLLQ